MDGELYSNGIPRSWDFRYVISFLANKTAELTYSQDYLFFIHDKKNSGFFHDIYNSELINRVTRQ